jgi:GT2 family glycosyltransferase
MNTPPKLSIVILNYKTRGLLKQCLRGFALLTFPFPIEILVVDNHSGDGSVEMVREQFPRIHLIASDRNGGFSYGMNLGIREAKGTYILLLNTDIILLDEAIVRVVTYMETRSDVGLAAPRLINPDGSVQYSCMEFPAWYIPLLRRTFLGKLPFAKRALQRYLMMRMDHGKNQEVDWVLGAAMLISRSVFDTVGLLDERFFLYFEDTDFCWRIWKAGKKVIYFAEAEMVHYHKRESATSPGLRGAFFNYITRIHIKSFWKYARKHWGEDRPHRSQTANL